VWVTRGLFVRIFLCFQLELCKNAYALVGVC
jgi:hypothetical protein